MTAKIILCGVDENGVERPILVDEKGTIVISTAEEESTNDS